MARYKEDHRETLQFLTGSLDRLLPEGSVARAIWAGLERLDFAAFDAAYTNDTVGRSAVNPRCLAAVWMLGMLRGVTSSVPLAALCSQDIEFRWLLGDASIEKSTLCDFRKNHQDALVRLSGQVLTALGQHGLLPGEQLGVDGTIVRAASSRHSNKNRKHIERHKLRLERLIHERLAESDKAPSKELTSLQQRRACLERALEQLEKASDRITISEPQARLLRQKDGSYAPGYNGQVVSDLDTGVIIHADVVEAGNDGGELAPQVRQAQAVLEGIKGDSTVQSVAADGAYHNTHQLNALEQDGIACYVPDKRLTNRQAPGVAAEFQASAFTYDQQSDTFCCPQGQTLKRRKLNPGKTAMQYHAGAGACQSCPAKPRCCPATKGGRSVNRSLHAEFLKTVAARLQTDTGQQQRRARWVVCEGVFARLVEQLHWRRCRMWGRSGARMELLWRQLTHNLLLLTGAWQPLVAKPKEA